MSKLRRSALLATALLALTSAAMAEPKPGIAPSPAHLARVIETMKSTGAKVILVQPFQNRKTADNVARQTGGVVLEMPQQPGVRPGTDSYFGLMEDLQKLFQVPVDLVELAPIRNPFFRQAVAETEEVLYEAA